MLPRSAGRKSDEDVESPHSFQIFNSFIWIIHSVLRLHTKLAIVKSLSRYEALQSAPWRYCSCWFPLADESPKSFGDGEPHVLSRSKRKVQRWKPEIPAGEGWMHVNSMRRQWKYLNFFQNNIGGQLWNLELQGLQSKEIFFKCPRSPTGASYCLNSNQNQVVGYAAMGWSHATFRLHGAEQKATPHTFVLPIFRRLRNIGSYMPKQLYPTHRSIKKTVFIGGISFLKSES